MPERITKPRASGTNPKRKRRPRGYTCKACRDTSLNSKGGPCHACQRRKGAT